MDTKRNHLSHVDGLRALAVLSVIFFHFGIPGFSGGYIGVDIFFVISGFLITRIIVAEIELTGRFSFINFYQRRVRRLFPALLFVLVLTSLAALLLFTPENLVQYGGSLASAALSVSNVLFWYESGYFDAASHLKPLLHTWSLSVEEQFYMVWPLLLLFMASKSKKIAAIIILGLMSFALNYYYVNAAQPGFESALFFLTPFRVFEFSFGAICVYLEKNYPANRSTLEFTALLGLALIAYSFFTLDQSSLFPYLNALPCCTGTALVILSRGSVISKLCLENKLAVAIGLLSYSLYLVHWPIYVFARYIFIDVSSVAMISAMFIGSLLLAVISYFYIERPFRYGVTFWHKNWVYKVTLSGMLLMCLLGLALKFSDGLVWRYSSATLSSSQIEGGKSKRFKDLNSGCNLMVLENADRCDMTRPIQILVFGDSHEPDGYNMFNYIYGDSEEVNIISFGTVNDCQFKIDATGVSSEFTALACQERFATLNSQALINKLTHIVYSSHISFEYYKRDLWQVLDSLMKRNSNIRLIALGGYIQTAIGCASIRNKEGSFDSCKAQENVVYFNPDERKESKIPEANSMNYLYINKFELLCPDRLLSSCATFANEEPMSYDEHHLSYGFARHVGRLISRKYKAELVLFGLPQE